MRAAVPHGAPATSLQVPPQLCPRVPPQPHSVTRCHIALSRGLCRRPAMSPLCHHGPAVPPRASLALSPACRSAPAASPRTPRVAARCHPAPASFRPPRVPTALQCHPVPPTARGVTPRRLSAVTQPPLRSPAVSRSATRTATRCHPAPAPLRSRNVTPRPPPPPTTHTRARAPGGARRVPARGSAAEDRRSAAPRPSPRPRPRPGPGAHCAPHAGGPRWRRRRRAPRAAPDNRGRRGGVGVRALPAFLRPRTATPRRAARPRARPHPAARGRPVAWCGASGCAMGERLELRLKSPVGAEPAVYPWPLPVYVSTGGGAGGALRPFGFTRRFAVSCRRASRCPRVTRLRLVPVCPAASERCPSGAGSASEPRALPGGSPCPGPARCPRCRGSAPRAA